MKTDKTSELIEIQPLTDIPRPPFEEWLRKVDDPWLRSEVAEKVGLILDEKVGSPIVTGHGPGVEDTEEGS